MEYKAVTKLQMFCLDFRKQHIFTPDKTGLFLECVKIMDLFMKQIRIYFTLSEGIDLLYVQVQTLQKLLTIMRLQYNREICYATKLIYYHTSITRNVGKYILNVTLVQSI